MNTFIYDVLNDLCKKSIDLSRLTFILPSKRAGLFLKHQLPQFITKPILSPKILSIEEFVENLSKLKAIGNTELLFQFYDSYKKLKSPENLDSFETFSKWGQTLLQDFNEIDRHLIPHDKIFGYLKAIKEIEKHHWSLEENQTEFIKNYLTFWDKLHLYYEDFTTSLLKKNLGYQGLIYRVAAHNIKNYCAENTNKHHIFLGFNALNTAEETIIQELLNNGSADIYWDIDSKFINNPTHDAGLFTQQHKRHWSYFNKHPFNWISNYYSQEKEIQIIGVPKNVGQAKYVGQIIENLQIEYAKLENTAIVLGDESLLLPLLNSFPPEIESLNITMGLPLKNIPLATLFQYLLELQKSNSASIYHKDVLNIINHSFIRPLFLLNGIDYSEEISRAIKSSNLVFLTTAKIKELTGHQLTELIEVLFSPWGNDIINAIKACKKLIYSLKNHLTQNKKTNLLSLEYLYRFNELFNSISHYNDQYGHIDGISTLYSVYKELLQSETLDFQGEPLQGLQVMGMLESRILDFETVIITSVNEGILPAGKSNNTFIPLDVKVENNLPTYKEKDAVYTYHFYRLLQRAKKIYLLYNTEADVLNGGEKSRFITQMEFEGTHQLNHLLVSPKIPVVSNELKSIKKTPKVVESLKIIANKGFSPSSLTNYIRNPIDFYYQKILNINELEEVEETLEANTIGTVVHNTLEDFYKPLQGQILTLEILKSLKSKINDTVVNHFKITYKDGDISKGKNLIVFEIAKRYITNFLNLEIADIKAGNVIKILAIESDLKVSISISEIDFPVHLTGKVDRLDEYNGCTRIIDYKTGKVQANQVEIVDWKDILTDYNKFSKSFQILTYAYMLQKSKNLSFPFEAGIISFKNLSSGIIKFAKKDKPGSRSKDHLINHETLEAFEKELKKLIIEICNPDINFTEKEV